jgi:hypothetical protein
MRIEDIVADPALSFLLMERYVNDGSPSGFTFTNTTSVGTNPREGASSFKLREVFPRPATEIVSLGTIPASIFASHDSSDAVMFVHPDMIENSKLVTLAEWHGQSSPFEAVPTSSARTVAVMRPGLVGFLKLHFEGYLGRIVRAIDLKRAQAALENDSILYRLISQGAMPRTFGYFRETGARVYQRQYEGSSVYWGMVWRSPAICGLCADTVRYLVPAFSLFSRDLRNPSDPTLLSQLGEVWGHDKARVLLDDLLAPVVSAYFAMIRNAGLQGEWHSQNVVFGFDSSWQCVTTALRDMESIDRDLPLMSRARVPSDLVSYPYKCLEAHQYNYSIKHSFMFDHKLGEYLLAPIIDHACQVWNVDTSPIENAVIDLVASETANLPKHYFPTNGSWYNFDKQYIDQSVESRPYLERKNPRFRR